MQKSLRSSNTYARAEYYRLTSYYNCKKVLLLVTHWCYPYKDTQCNQYLYDNSNYLWWKKVLLTSLQAAIYNSTKGQFTILNRDTDRQKERGER